MRHGILLIVVLAAACSSSGDTTTRPEARDLVVKEACDKYVQCGQVGQGKTFATREACEIDQRAFWERTWPPENCDGKIDQTAFGLCVNAIRAVECGNTLDLLNVYANKCPRDKICPPPPQG